MRIIGITNLLPIYTINNTQNKSYDLSCVTDKQNTSSSTTSIRSGLNFTGLIPFLNNENKLLNAIKQGDVRKVKKILTKTNININAQDKDGNTAIHVAIKKHNNEIVEMLLKHKNRKGENNINLEIPNRLGKRPIHNAVIYENTTAVKWLTDNNVDINAQNNSGNTPLHLAVFNVNMDIVKILLSAKGINLRIKNNKGKFPVEIDGIGHIQGSGSLSKPEIFFKCLEYADIIMLLQKAMNDYSYLQIIDQTIYDPHENVFYCRHDVNTPFTKVTWDDVEEVRKKHYQNISDNDLKIMQTDLNTLINKEPMERIRAFSKYILPSGKSVGDVIVNSEDCNETDKSIINMVKMKLFDKPKEYSKLQRAVHPDLHPDIEDASQLSVFLNNLKEFN